MSHLRTMRSTMAWAWNCTTTKAMRQEQSGIALDKGSTWMKVEMMVQARFLLQYAVDDQCAVDEENK